MAAPRVHCALWLPAVVRFLGVYHLLYAQKRLITPESEEQGLHRASQKRISLILGS